MTYGNYYDANDDGADAGGDWNGDDGNNNDVFPPDVGPIIPPDPTPPPVGQPFQIKSVALTSGHRTQDPFTIVWNVWGDEGEIDHYYVYLFLVRPELLPAAQWDWNGGMALCEKVPAGQHKYVGKLTNAPPEPLSAKHQYLRPMVVAVPKNSSMTPHTAVGAARALFSSLPSEQAAAQAFWLPHVYRWSGGVGWQQFTPGASPPPPGNSRAVWRGGPLQTARAFPSPPPPQDRMSTFAPIRTRSGYAFGFKRRTWTQGITAFSATRALTEAPASPIPP